jgi:ribonuclease P protein component
LGKSFAHPLIVLIVLEDQPENVRIAVAAGRSLGGAVMRNQAKRLMRAAINPLLNHIRPGNDLIWIARKPILDATFQEIQGAISILLQRAGLIQTDEL